MRSIISILIWSLLFPAIAFAAGAVAVDQITFDKCDQGKRYTIPQGRSLIYNGLTEDAYLVCSPVKGDGIILKVIVDDKLIEGNLVTIGGMAGGRKMPGCISAQGRKIEVEANKRGSVCLDKPARISNK